MFASNIADASTPGIVRELQAKLSVYAAVSNKDIETEEKSKALHAIFGKILLACCQLTLKDNLNSYAALKSGIEDKKMMQIEAQFAQETNTSNPKVDVIFDELKDKISSSGMVGMLDGLAEAMKKANSQ